MLFISDNAKERLIGIMAGQGLSLEEYFIRVTVTSGGCSGLAYKMDFDNEAQPMDQNFEDKGIKLVTDLKSFLYLANTTLDFSGGLNGKGFFFENPNSTRECSCGDSFAV